MMSSGHGVLVWRFSDDPDVIFAERRDHSGWQPGNLRKDFSPATVIDVGAAEGTPPLYEAFPDAYHVLIEPVAECHANLDRWLAKLDGEALGVAVGKDVGEATIHVDRNQPWASSLLQNTQATPPPLEERKVELTTLDRLLDQRGWKGPFGLKIDTEGFEREVIEGASHLLTETQFVIAEVRVGDRRFEHSYSHAEFIASMDRNGFELVDILDGLKWSWRSELVFFDAIFRRRERG
jgi:FkbM family methyltransferase